MNKVRMLHYDVWRANVWKVSQTSDKDVDVIDDDWQQAREYIKKNVDHILIDNEVPNLQTLDELPILSGVELTFKNNEDCTAFALMFNGSFK